MKLFWGEHGHYSSMKFHEEMTFMVFSARKNWFDIKLPFKFSEVAVFFFTTRTWKAFPCETLHMSIILYHVCYKNK